MRPDKGAVITGEVLYRMTYTRTVVKEILRFRPPAPMVPQVQQPYFATVILKHGRGVPVVLPAVHRLPSQGVAGTLWCAGAPTGQLPDVRRSAAGCRSCSRTSG